MKIGDGRGEFIGGTYGGDKLWPLFAGRRTLGLPMFHFFGEGEELVERLAGFSCHTSPFVRI